MYDYSRLPTLVLNEIFGYLSVKERVKAKSVCRSWKEEIELRDQKRDTLVLHLGPYPRNLHWAETNNGGLMKFENSFQMKRLNILEQPLTRELLKKTKKLAIVNFYQDLLNSSAWNIQPYLGYFDRCEEIEIHGLSFAPTLDLPKLKLLVIKESSIKKLVLNCPSLEVLSWNWEVKEIHFQDAKKLKRLICFGWPASVSLKGKFSSLAYLNMYAAHDKPVDDRLLDRMPKLKRLVLYSRNLRADLQIIREQQKRFGLPNLEVLFNGFRDPEAEIELDMDTQKLSLMDGSVGQLHANYSKLAENSPWRVWIDYSQLFSKFKILPSDFFERFSNSFGIDITEVTNYTHLLGFLKCYPFIRQLRVNFSKVKADRVLDLVYSLQPSLIDLTIQVECPSDVLKIDLSFMFFFNLFFLHLEATHLPVQFLRKVAAKRGAHFSSFVFHEITIGHRMLINFPTSGVILFDTIRGSQTPQFPSVEQLIAHMQTDAQLRTFLM